jgi:hypothetical protein
LDLLVGLDEKWGLKLCFGSETIFVVLDFFEVTSFFENIELNGSRRDIFSISSLHIEPYHKLS